eukprot:74627-Chlamydomonas_euryale.AAC.1
MQTGQRSATGQLSGEGQLSDDKRARQQGEWPEVAAGQPVHSVEGQFGALVNMAVEAAAARGSLEEAARAKGGGKDA